MPRAKLPKVDFFHEDFSRGVEKMSREEIGDYILLLCAIWDSRDWSIAYDVEPLHHTLHCRRADVRKRVARLIELDKIFVGADGRLHNDRADRDRAGGRDAREKTKGNSARLRPTSPQLALNLAATSAELGGKPPEKESKNNGTRGDSRAGLQTPDSNKESSLSARARDSKIDEDEHAFRRALAMLPRAAVQAIVAIRRDRDKPLTGEVGETLARALRKFPDPAVAAQEMVDRGWLSINAKWPSQQHHVGKPAQHAQSPPGSAADDRHRAEWKRVLAEKAKGHG